MNVIGVGPDGSDAFVRTLDQGADPRIVAHDEGFVVVRPLDAVRNAEQEIELRLEVRPRAGERRPRLPGRGQDPDLDLSGDVALEVRQRVAAYALVTSRRGLLATEFSNRTSVPGRWGLPGGGVDDGEQPQDAVLREVAEETEQTVVVGRLVAVQTSHWVGRSPRDTIEDYHAVRLVYRADCSHPSRPKVIDVGGTTESARWVGFGSWRSLRWTAGWRQILRDQLD